MTHFNTFSGEIELNSRLTSAALATSSSSNCFGAIAAPTRKAPLKVSFSPCPFGGLASDAVDVAREQAARQSDAASAAESRRVIMARSGAGSRRSHDVR